MITKFCGFYGPLYGKYGKIYNLYILRNVIPCSIYRSNQSIWCFLDIKSFTYVFPCDFARKNNEIDIYGTGGMILQDMKNLLAFLPGLKRLDLVDLELDGFDGMF